MGCGKTAVAFLALLAAAGSGAQGALMAPTEVLAEQHAARLGDLLAQLPAERRPRAALLKGGMRARERREVRRDRECPLLLPCQHVLLLRAPQSRVCVKSPRSNVCRG